MFVVAQFGAATDAIMAATVDGKLDNQGVQFIGQCAGMIHDIPSVEELVDRLVTEAVQIMETQHGMLVQNGQSIVEKAV
jgi:enoyl-[acyl-carrier protein] reductase II